MAWTLGKANSLKAGDIVRMAPHTLTLNSNLDTYQGPVNEPFQDMMVTKVEPDKVHFFRPWMKRSHTEDFSSGYPYIGVETFWVWRDSSTVWLIEKH